MEKVIHYDIASATYPGISWGASTLKPHIVLRYKGIPYETVFLSFDEIRSHHEKLGMKPSSGGPSPYTCPAIKHGDVLLQDSHAIANYLEKAFPDTPSIFPNSGIRALQTAFDKLMVPMITSLVVPKLLAPQTAVSIGGAGGEYFDRTRSEMFGVQLDKLLKEEEKPQVLEEWRKFIKTVDDLYKAEEGGPWMAGRDFSWADAPVLALVRCVELLDPETFKVVEAEGPAIMEAFRAGAQYCSFN